jgi:DNA-binding transcriptional ArsR family regulator
MPIQDLASSRLKYAELGSYGRDFCTILNKWDFQDTITRTLTNELENNVVALEDRSGLKSKNPVSGKMKLAIAARKKSFHELLHHVKGCLDNLDEKKRSAAQIVYPSFEQHNTNLANLRQPDVSHHLKALLIDLKKNEYADARAELAIDGKIAEVEATQKAIESLNIQVLKAKKASALPRISKFIIPIRNSLEKIISHLNIMEQMEPGTYKPAVDEVNELVSLISSKLQGRKTRADKAAPKLLKTGTSKKKPKKTKSLVNEIPKTDNQNVAAPASPEEKKQPDSVKQSEPVKPADTVTTAETENLRDSEFEPAI